MEKTLRCVRECRWIPVWGCVRAHRDSPQSAWGCVQALYIVGQGAVGMAPEVLRRTPVVGLGHVGTRACGETTLVAPPVAALGLRGA